MHRGLRGEKFMYDIMHGTKKYHAHAWFQISIPKDSMKNSNVKKYSSWKHAASPPPPSHLLTVEEASIGGFLLAKKRRLQPFLPSKKYQPNTPSLLLLILIPLSLFLGFSEKRNRRKEVVAFDISSLKLPYSIPHHL